MSIFFFLFRSCFTFIHIVWFQHLHLLCIFFCSFKCYNIFRYHHTKLHSIINIHWPDKWSSSHINRSMEFYLHPQLMPYNSHSHACWSICCDSLWHWFKSTNLIVSCVQSSTRLRTVLINHAANIVNNILWCFRSQTNKLGWFSCNEMWIHMEIFFAEMQFNLYEINIFKQLKDVNKLIDFKLKKMTTIYVENLAQISILLLFFNKTFNYCSIYIIKIHRLQFEYYQIPLKLVQSIGRLSFTDELLLHLRI